MVQLGANPSASRSSGVRTSQRCSLQRCQTKLRIPNRPLFEMQNGREISLQGYYADDLSGPCLHCPGHSKLCSEHGIGITSTLPMQNDNACMAGSPQERQVTNRAGGSFLVFVICYGGMGGFRRQ